MNKRLNIDNICDRAELILRGSCEGPYKDEVKRIIKQTKLRALRINKTNTGNK